MTKNIKNLLMASFCIVGLGSAIGNVMATETPAGSEQSQTEVASSQKKSGGSKLNIVRRSNNGSNQQKEIPKSRSTTKTQKPPKTQNGQQKWQRSTKTQNSSMKEPYESKQSAPDIRKSQANVPNIQGKGMPKLNLPKMQGKEMVLFRPQNAKTSFNQNAISEEVRNRWKNANNNLMSNSNSNSPSTVSSSAVSPAFASPGFYGSSNVKGFVNSGHNFYGPYNTSAEIRDDMFGLGSFASGTGSGMSNNSSSIFSPAAGMNSNTQGNPSPLINRYSPFGINGFFNVNDEIDKSEGFGPIGGEVMGNKRTTPSNLGSGSNASVKYTSRFEGPMFDEDDVAPPVINTSTPPTNNYLADHVYDQDSDDDDLYGSVKEETDDLYEKAIEEGKTDIEAGVYSKKVAEGMNKELASKYAKYFAEGYNAYEDTRVAEIYATLSLEGKSEKYKSDYVISYAFKKNRGASDLESCIYASKIAHGYDKVSADRYVKFFMDGLKKYKGLDEKDSNRLADLYASKMLEKGSSESKSDRYLDGYLKANRKGFSELKTRIYADKISGGLDEEAAEIYANAFVIAMQRYNNDKHKAHIVATLAIKGKESEKNKEFYITKYIEISRVSGKTAAFNHIISEIEGKRNRTPMQMDEKKQEKAMKFYDSSEDEEESNEENDEISSDEEEKCEEKSEYAGEKVLSFVEEYNEGLRMYKDKKHAEMYAHLRLQGRSYGYVLRYIGEFLKAYKFSNDFIKAHVVADWSLRCPNSKDAKKYIDKFNSIATKIFHYNGKSEEDATRLFLTDRDDYYKIYALTLSQIKGYDQPKSSLYSRYFAEAKRKGYKDHRAHIYAEYMLDGNSEVLAERKSEWVDEKFLELCDANVSKFNEPEVFDKSFNKEKFDIAVKYAECMSDGSSDKDADTYAKAFIEFRGKGNSNEKSEKYAALICKGFKPSDAKKYISLYFEFLYTYEGNVEKADANACLTMKKAPKEYINAYMIAIDKGLKAEQCDEFAKFYLGIINRYKNEELANECARLKFIDNKSDLYIEGFIRCRLRSFSVNLYKFAEWYEEGNKIYKTKTKALKYASFKESGYDDARIAKELGKEVIKYREMEELLASPSYEENLTAGKDKYDESKHAKLYAKLATMGKSEEYINYYFECLSNKSHQDPDAYATACEKMSKVYKENYNRRALCARLVLEGRSVDRAEACEQIIDRFGVEGFKRYMKMGKIAAIDKATYVGFVLGKRLPKEQFSAIKEAYAYAVSILKYNDEESRAYANWVSRGNDMALGCKYVAEFTKAMKIFNFAKSNDSNEDRKHIYSKSSAYAQCILSGYKEDVSRRFANLFYEYLSRAKTPEERYTAIERAKEDLHIVFIDFRAK